MSLFSGNSKRYVVPDVLGASLVELAGDSADPGWRPVGKFFNFKPNFVRSILQTALAPLVFAEDQHVVVALAVVDDAVAEARRANAIVVYGVSVGAMNTVGRHYYFLYKTRICWLSKKKVVLLFRI